MITLEVNGSQYTNFLSASVRTDMEALSRSFSFVVLSPDVTDTPIPVRAGDACRIFVEGDLVLTGWVEKIELNYSRTNHSLTISGRDKTCDLVDSTLGQLESFSAAGKTLKSLIEKVVDYLGMDVEVIEEVDVEPFKKEEDIFNVNPGDNCFKYIDEYAMKRQVLITSDPEGNIVITRNNKSSVSGTLKHVIGSEDNNILNCSYSIDTTKRFREYRHIGASNALASNIAGGDSPDSLVAREDFWFDESIRTSRKRITMAKLSTTNEESGFKAFWEANIRSARSERVRVVTPGFRVNYNSGNLWKPNQLYELIDDFLGAQDPMVSSSVEYTYDRDEGSSTIIVLVGRFAYLKDVIGSGEPSFSAIGGFGIDDYFKAFNKAVNFIKGFF